MGWQTLRFHQNSSIMLSRCFLDPTIHAHTKNHQVSQSAKDLLAISEFILGIENLFLGDFGTGEPFEINEDIEDEIEALSSIYAETNEFFLDTKEPSSHESERFE